MALRRFLRLLPWLLLAFITLATLSSLAMRPHLGNAVFIERFGAFALLGFLFAVAYPRRIVTVLLLTVAIAVGLEFFQWLSPHRHARLSDLLVKAAGGAGGVVLCWLTTRVVPRFRSFLVVTS